MYYEEKIIGDKMYFRSTPRGEWELCSNLMLVNRIKGLKERVHRLESSIAIDLAQVKEMEA